MVHYDAVLKHVGEFGTYQKRMCFFAFLPSLSVGMHMMAMVFLAATPAHRCRAPEGAVLAARYNWSEPELLNMTIPWTKDDDGRQNNIVCDDKWLANMAQSIYMVGVLIGSITFGDLSDRFGRKVLMFVGIVLNLVSGISTMFAPNFTAFVILRLFVGVSSMGIYLVNFVLACEIVGPSRRTLVGTVDYVFFVLGYMLEAGLAYLIRTWTHLQLAISLLSVLWLPLWCVVTESPRWLLAKGRTEEARAIVEKMAKTNGVDFPDALWEKMVESKVDVKTFRYGYVAKNSSELIVVSDLPVFELSQDKLTETPDNDRFYSAWDLIRTPNLAKKSAIIFYNWGVITMVYYGLSLNTSALGGDDYINFFLSGLVEFPALLMSIIVIEKWGRRSPHIMFMVGGGVACICTLFVPSDLFPLTMTLAMIGKFGIAASFNIIYIWTGEIYPTVIRNLGLGVSSMWARVGGIISPFVALLADSWRPLPYIVFGGVSVLGGILCLMLPETLGAPLPQTLEEAEDFGKFYKSLLQNFIYYTM
uniref:Major facilitator superfamily (MFS) profile domain-containing protein n=1 Tax=Branchiostoma floridae TaxID=7739 RepID=C3ZGY0_BRAFL|eukprot:XP_002592116.1 hypothetical protein BRAFLDRAFT_59470 [Branchiostoma floridae]